MKWFNFSQNNSGGYFVRDENVCEEVFIQAPNSDRANAILDSMVDHSNYCECCGSRWHRVDYSDATDEPEIYGDKLSEGGYRGEARLHYADGRIETFKFIGGDL